MRGMDSNSLYTRFGRPSMTDRTASASLLPWMGGQCRGFDPFTGTAHPVFVSYVIAAGVDCLPARIFLLAVRSVTTGPDGWHHSSIIGGTIRD